jgi:hypothetical protein
MVLRESCRLLRTGLSTVFMNFIFCFIFVGDA